MSDSDEAFGLAPRSLLAQMIFGFVALVLLPAAAVGLPATWLMRGADTPRQQRWMNLPGQLTIGSRTIYYNHL